MKVRPFLVGGVAVTTMLGACTSDYPQVCTTLYALIPVVVLDAQGAPVANMVITDSVLRTHEKFTVPQEGGVWPLGTYHVFTDSYTSKVRESGDPVRVTGTNGTVSFGADYSFGVPGGCHVSKLAGPDTVVAH